MGECERAAGSGLQAGGAGRERERGEALEGAPCQLPSGMSGELTCVPSPSSPPSSPYASSPSFLQCSSVWLPFFYSLPISFTRPLPHYASPSLHFLTSPHHSSYPITPPPHHSSSLTHSFSPSLLHVLILQPTHPLLNSSQESHGFCLHPCPSASLPCPAHPIPPRMGRHVIA